MSRWLIHAAFLGRISYGTALEKQNLCERQIIDTPVLEETRNTLFILEHNPVYTVGLRSRDYTAEVEQKLQLLGAEFHRTNRGGLITFHGPGQMVAYPVINLKYFQLGMKAYVEKLEQTIIQTCKHFDLSATTSKDTGVWIGNNKIAAIGVHGKRFVTTHGLALNCDTDLTWFEHIIPCGIVGKGVTSLSNELNRTVTIDDATGPFLKAFSEVFDCEIKGPTCTHSCSSSHALSTH